MVRKLQELSTDSKYVSRKYRDKPVIGFLTWLRLLLTALCQNCEPDFICDSDWVVYYVTMMCACVMSRLYLLDSVQCVCGACVFCNSKCSLMIVKC